MPTNWQKNILCNKDSPLLDASFRFNRPHSQAFSNMWATVGFISVDVQPPRAWGNSWGWRWGTLGCLRFTLFVLLEQTHPAMTIAFRMYQITTLFPLEQDYLIVIVSALNKKNTVPLNAVHMYIFNNCWKELKKESKVTMWDRWRWSNLHSAIKLSIEELFTIAKEGNVAKCLADRWIS